MGLKENVIVGKKIPAGTGLRKYDKLEIVGEYQQRRRRDGEAGMSGDED